MIRAVSPLRLSAMATFVAVALSACLLLSFRASILAVRPALLASIVSVSALLAIVTLALALRARSAVPILLASGLLLVLGGGLANWLLSLQGVVILNELEGVPLAGGSHLQEFEYGPLSRPSELNLTLQLEELRLDPVSEGFVAVSRLRLIENGRGPHIVEVARNRSASYRTLRFHQGAFGFAPRIVITRDGEAVFDRHVPFTTRGRDGRSLSFEGAFDVAKEQLSVRAAVDLESLDDRLRGHPRLGLAVDHDGKRAGSGELTMGHFARLSDGYAIGFAGLKRWSEIDVSRRNYPQPMYAGAGLICTGLLLWPFTRRRR